MDLGGFPSWLLRDKDMKLRSNYTSFLTAIEKYFEKLIAIVKQHQFTDGGPIIAVQIENEFSTYGYTSMSEGDVHYLTFLKDILLRFGIDELMFACDYPSKLGYGSLHDMLMAISFQEKPTENLKYLKSVQPNKPAYVCEFWSGWYDIWNDKNHHDLGHHTWSTDEYVAELETTLELNASVNVHIFHGGTNFGFMAGKIGALHRTPGYIVTR